MVNYRPAEHKTDNLLEQLLLNRKLTDEKEVEQFLNPDYDTRPDPFLLNDMAVAVERVLKAIKNEEKVVIYSDYDCDGIPGAVVLHDFFTTIGYKNFVNYIPHRHYEGFGLSVEAIEKLHKDKADLIITIDCGTSDVEAVGRARELGIDVIITDHHEPPADLPPAVAVVNPRVGGDYPFPHLCGAAVVFRLVEALLNKGDFEVKEGKEKWWLDMVGLATIGDMVPLVGENRVYAHFGIKVLRKSRRPGLQQLLRKARANQIRLTEDDIGFTIAPRINAASRMDTPEDAFAMLSVQDEGQAGAYVTHLEKLNNERKGLVASMTKELKKRLSDMVEMPDVLVLGNPEWRPALVGLCASSLASQFNRPVFLWGRDGNGVIKGSCRAGGGLSVVKLMTETGDQFLEYGGHHASGGFSVKEEAIFHLGEALNCAYKKLGEKALADEELLIDKELRLEDINEKFLSTLRQLAPYGMGNPKPLFSFSDLTPDKVEQFGKTKEHLKLNFKADGQNLEAIAFFATPDQYEKTPEVGKQIKLLAHIEESYFMNRHQVRLRIVDLLPC